MYTLGCDEESPEAWSVFHNYSEPFNRECRAYGRLHESGHQELATKCFGYMLLDEANERTVIQQFPDECLTFQGAPGAPGIDIYRPRFLGKSGRPPPIRGLVKEFAQEIEPLSTKDVRRMYTDIIRLHQLGIIGLDIAARNFVGNPGKLCDFSIAITTPHYRTNPELNPHLTTGNIKALEAYTFNCSINDYWDIDEMVQEWNGEHRVNKKKIAFRALPFNRPRAATGYNLRAMPSQSPSPSRGRVYTLVDPRRYNWRASSHTRPGNGAITKRPRQRLSANPPKWCYEGSAEFAARMDSHRQRNSGVNMGTYAWEHRDGLLFPVKRI